MVNILNKTQSAVNQLLFELRHKDIQKDRGKFRNNMRLLGVIMAYEVSRKLEYQQSLVETSLGTSSIDILKDQPVIIGILRAAIPFYNGFIELFNQADGGFIGAYRDERQDDITIQLDYLAIPNIDDRVLIIVDPMLATGKSLVSSVEKIKTRGTPRHIHFVAAVAAPEGIDYLSKSLDGDYSIWVGSLDEKLNDHAYIVPGLGDAGDLSFGPKV